MDTAACLNQPPGYRLAVANHRYITSRQSTAVELRPDMTSRDVYRMGSRGVDREVAVARTAGVLNGRMSDDRVRRLSSPKAVEQDIRGAVYQRPTAWTSRPATTAPGTCSLPLERAQDRVGSTATSRLFSSTSRHPQIHESSYSAPADCTGTAHHRPHHVPAALLPCGPGVRATKVSVRTEYHFTSTHRPNMTSSSVKDGQRSSSRSQQGARLWVGVAQSVDIRPISGTALTATVDCNNRELYINCLDYQLTWLSYCFLSPLQRCLLLC